MSTDTHPAASYDEAYRTSLIAPRQKVELFDAWGKSSDLVLQAGMLRLR